jgi:hypothetical protein
MRSRVEKARRKGDKNIYIPEKRVIIKLRK